MNAKDITLVLGAGALGAMIALFADQLIGSNPAHAAIFLPEVATPTLVEPASALDESDLLWGLHEDGARIRTCVSSTNSRTLTPPRCSEWTG